MTRRNFVTRAGLLGGGAAAYRAMLALGLLAGESLAREPQRLPPAESSAAGRQKRRILILGAGLAGMSAAYELGKLGYECEIFEVRDRVGGRCWSVRRGTRETDTDGNIQTCEFAEGNYLNPGPARIPGHHLTTLGYCREFGVALEIFNNWNDSAYYCSTQTGGPGRVRLREARTDLRGYLNELLAKSIQRDAVDRPLTKDDKEALIEFLRVEGGLSPDLSYRAASPPDAPGGGFDSRGFSYEALPGAGDQRGRITEPLDFEAVLKAGFGGALNFHHEMHQQPTMFQPVGGMDRIAKAFEERVGRFIRYRTAVQEIRRTSDGRVRLVVAKTDGGAPREVRGDYCICTIPLSVLRSIPADFSPPFAEAIASVPYLSVGKIGLQFRRRFWEEDDHILGGISWTDQKITQVMYPNYGYLSRGPGVLVGSYHFGDVAEQVGAMSPAQRVEFALGQGEKIHPQYRKEFEPGKAFSVSWQKIPHNLGGWAMWSRESRASVYPLLNRADGPFFLAGEHLTYLGSWMAGAFESARAVVAAVHAQVLAA